MSAGEDWPDAYRYTPMHPEESRGCVVVFWHPEWGCPAFQLYRGLLFGLPNAVTSFNRFSRFAEAVVRRFLFVLFSMYFDDATMQDWGSTAVGAQSCVAETMEVLGSPWAEGKTQACASTGDFLGLVHDLSRVPEGIVSFWPRPKLQRKVMAMVNVAKQCGLPSGAAAKLYGVCNFLESGIFARIGRAGLNPIKERQYDQTYREVAHDRGARLLASRRSNTYGRAFGEESPMEGKHGGGLERALDLLEDLMKVQPRREYELGRGQGAPRFLLASDAAYDDGVGMAGFLLVTDPGMPEEARQGVVVDIPSSLYALWGVQNTYIAQLELVMAMVAMVECASEMRGRRGVWFIDNTAALFTLVKGRSNKDSLDEIAFVVHAALYALRAQIYYEWVESESNWADGISRHGTRDPWVKRHSFTLQRCGVCTMLLRLPFRAVIQVFECL